MLGGEWSESVDETTGETCFTSARSGDVLRMPAAEPAAAEAALEAAVAAVDHPALKAQLAAVLAALPAAEMEVCRGKLCNGTARPISWFSFNPSTNGERWLQCDACREKRRMKHAEKRAAAQAAGAE